MTTSTIRRTATITANPQLATLPTVEELQAAKTAKQSKAPKKPAQYNGVVLARVNDKATGECLGYLAKPEQPVDASGNVKCWYQVRFDESVGWHCNCPATKECKHVKAVVEVCEAHAAEAATGVQQAVEELTEIVAAMTETVELTRRYTLEENMAFFDAAYEQQRKAEEAVEAPAKVVDLDAERRRRNEAPLNGNRGFSLMRR